MSMRSYSFILLIALSGCVWGNKIVNPTTNIGASGFYYTLPQSYSLSTTQSTASSPQTVSAPVSDIPVHLQDTFTDITEIEMQTAGSGVYIAFEPTTGSPLDAFFFSLATDNKTMSAYQWDQDSTWINPPMMPWTDPSCFWSTQWQINPGTIGALNSGDASTQDLTFATVNMLGHLQFTVTYIQTFTGSCTASFTAMQSCYESVANCPSDPVNSAADYQDRTRQIYEPWIPSGAMTTADIPNTTTMQYSVVYQ
jgi:hypothetical protein